MPSDDHLIIRRKLKIDISRAEAADAAARAEAFTGQLGQNSTAGQLVYNDGGIYRLVDADLSAAAAAIAGILLTSGNTGQSCLVQTAEFVNPDATVAVGTTYCAGPNAGEIVPDSDVANPSRKSIVGVGVTSSQIQLAITNSGAVHA